MNSLVKVAVVLAGLSLTGNAVKAQQKLGHINSVELIQAMPEIKTADAAMETWQKQKQASLDQMNTDYQKKTAAITEKQKMRSEANKDVVDKELQAMFMEIQGFDKRMADAQEQAQQEYQKKRDELYNPILQKVNTALNAVAKEKGYAYVLDISNPAVVYYGGGDDLQPEVKAKLGITAAATK